MTAATTGAATQPPPGAETIASFVAEQAESMTAGLAQSDDPLLVRAVLRSHDSAHGCWLRHISSLAQHDAAAADRLAGLYTLHGRIAGTLEGRRHQRNASSALRARAHDVLTRQLHDSTADVVAGLTAG